MNMERVLITGYSGFTGRYLAEGLRKAGAEVVGLVHGNGCETREVAGDLTSLEDMRRVAVDVKPTHVVHLAGISSPAHDDVREFYDVNLFGTLNLLEAFGGSHHRLERIVIASSANVYGTPEVEMIRETMCPKPVNHYGNSKLAMENMARVWADRLPLTIVRPFNYTGRGQDERFVISKIVGHLRRHERVLELGNLDVARDFSDVRDVSEAYIRLLGGPTVHEGAVNICSGRAYTLRQILESAFQISGWRPEVRVNPLFVRRSEIPRLVGDNDRLQLLTGFRPSIEMEDTLRWMLLS